MRFPGFRPVSALVARLSLRTHLLILLSLVVAVLILDRGRELTRIRGQEIARTQAELYDAAQNGAARQADVIAEAKALLRMAVETPVTTAGPCHDAFQRAQEDLPWLKSVVVLDLKGFPLCSSGNKKIPGSVADRPYFREAIAKNGFAFSDYIIGRVTGEPVIILALPSVHNAIMETVVIAVIDLDWMSRIAAETGSKAGGKVLLVDRGATVLAAYPDPESWVGRNLARQSSFVSRLKATGSTTKPVSLDGEMQLLGHVKLTDTGAVLAVMMPLEKALAGATRQARVEIAKIAVAGILAFLVIWFGGELLVLRPIRGLTHAAERLGSGELTASVPTDGLAPELRRLGESFNIMALQLRARDAELRRANEKLAELASKDALTGIANRRGFDQQLAAEWNRARRNNKPVALLAIDVDHFKKFNDCYGHLAGDACLQRVATSLLRIARRAGDFPARIGGEEFALLLPETDLDAATAIAESVRQEIEAMNIAHTSGSEGRVTVSVGAAASRADRGDSLHGLVDLADAALYRAKRAGRNRVVGDWPTVSLAS